jgi:outer membrane protein
MLAVGARAETVELKFEDLPKLVAERNENASGAESLADSARARTGSFGRSYLPTIDAQAGSERFQTGRYPYRSEPYGGVEAKLNLFRGGRDKLEEGARESQLRGARASAKKTYETELTQARKAFWELVSLRETASLLKEALSENEKHVSMAARRIARGLAAETDRLEFQIYASQLGEEVESLEHETLLVQLRLAALLGAAPGAQFTTLDAVPHDHDDALLSAGFDSAAHPDVAWAKASAETAGFQKGEAMRRWTPSVDVYGGYFLYTLRERDYLDRGARDDRVIGARLSLPLFDGLRTLSDARAFSAQAEGYRHQANQRARAMTAQVEITKEDLKHEHELVHRSEERIAQGKRYLALTLDEYGRGVKNSIDVLGAAQRFTTFEKQYAERRREYQTVRCDLLALLGK